MAQTSTSSEALVQLQKAIRDWSTKATGIARQTNAAATALVTQVEAAVRKRAAEMAAIEAALGVATTDSQRDRLVDELRTASASLESAHRALQKAHDCTRAAQTLQRRIDDSSARRAPEASRALERKLKALSDYRTAVPNAATASPASNPIARYDYGVDGIVDVPIGQATFDDNPIRDGYHKGGADRADYRWAVETWETIVRPGILAGKTRDDFAQRDLAMGRETGFRRTAGVYDMFLGSDPVEFSRRADGTLDVPSGRHRVEIARQLGLTHLPGRLHG